MSAGTYDHYKLKLDSAYINKDHFEAAIQLANLNAPNEIIFKQFDKGMRENPQNCFRVFEWYNSIMALVLLRDLGYIFV